MSKKYTYSREIETREGKETFSAVEFDSFDEAIKAVDRGISDRQIQIKRTLPLKETQIDPAIVLPTQPNNSEIRKDTTASPSH